MKTTRHEDIRDGLALNVKFHGNKLQDGGTDAQRAQAWESTQETWWRDANEAARECGYIGATACGRSGGWCAPYDAYTFEDDENEPRFIAFAEKIEALMRAVPRMFAENLAQVMADDEADEREAARITAERARDAAILAMVPRLAAALQAMAETAAELCPSIDSAVMHDTREVLQEYAAASRGGIAYVLDDARAAYPGEPRYVVDGCESEEPDAPYSGSGEFPPFVILDVYAQENLPGKYATRAEAERALKLTEQRQEHEAAAVAERRELERQFCEPFRDDDMRDAMRDGSTIIGEAFNALRGARSVSLLSVEAWRDGASWTWNNWHKLASVPMSWADLPPRALLRELRAAGYVTGAGKLAVEDDGHNIVVMAKGTREPLLAVAYGEAP